ncbi:MAG: DNA translocase FtsK 4TM domain-containing protein [Myxococcota bacterium]
MAKRARSEKSVLSKQDIASRKKVLSEERLKTHGAGRRALFGVFVLAASVMALLSVATFDVRDRVGPGFVNAVGPVGHALAETLRGLLGICAYVLPASGIYAAVVLFVGARDRRRWPQLLCLVLLSLSGAVLAQLVLDGTGWSHPPGGALGEGLAAVLTGLFSVVGTVVLVSAVCVAALIIGTQFAFLRLCALAWRGAKHLGAQARIAAFVWWEKQKAAHALRREAAAKAKEQEAAFLAQLEADEAALTEAEREADEAEKMAEEAHRLARQAEEAKTAKRKQHPSLDVARPERTTTQPELTTAHPERSRGMLPPGDPAWALTLAPPAPKAEPEAPKKKERKSPTLVTPPPPPPAAFISLPPTDLVELDEKTAAAPPSVAALPGPSVSEAPPGASPPSVAPASAAARTPVIVEPKAPPKPTKKKEQEQFEFVGDRKHFAAPPLDVLELDKKERTALDKEAFFSTAEKLRAKLADFGIDGEVVEIRPGPVVTMYEFLPGPGIKISKIASLADDLAMAMEAMRVRIVAPIPGKGVVGIEVPNKDRETVYLKEIAEQDAFQKSPSRLTMCLGKDIEGMPYVLDLAKAPHLLIAGTTGSGKSVAVNSMIMSILLKSTPEEVRFIMVDPKMLELSVYEGIPHLLLPVVTDPKKAALALRWAVEEMERRYQMLADAGVRNIAGYNKLVESQDAPKTEKKEKKPEEEVVEAAAVPAPKPPPAPAAPSKKRKLLIVDVADGESEEEALKRNQMPALGVAAPKDEPEDVREAVSAEVEAEVKAAQTEAEIRVDESVLPEQGTPAVEAAAEEKSERKKLPYIVVIIDELADLMMVASREVETYIARLAQMARAAGIHLMVATQRPSTDVVTGVIKANFPTRISFMLRSKPDSMTILGTIGAEALLGMGDMLIMPPTSAHLQRVHGAFVSETEIKRAVDHLKAQGKPVYDESILKAREEESEGGGEEDELSDELYDQALAAVSEMRTVSISMLQRKMRIGYNRAARMIERMERDGVVGPADGAKPREVLIRPVGEMPGAGAM